MEDKMKDPDFLGDTVALPRPEIKYDPQIAFEMVKTQLIERI
jgi:hypothetical protein